MKLYVGSRGRGSITCQYPFMLLQFAYVFLMLFYGFEPPCNLIAMTWVRNSTVTEFLDLAMIIFNQVQGGLMLCR